MKNYKALVGLGSAILLMGVLLFFRYGADAKDFKDLPTTNIFYDYIMALSMDGVVSGYSDGTFKPNDNVSRGAMAKFVKNGLGFTDNISCGGFKDVPTNHTFYNEITTLKCKGVVSGYSDGTFKPNNSVTRGEAMKFAIQGSRIKKNNQDFLNNAIGSFPDVPSTNPFYNYVLSAYSKGIVSGYSSGTFGVNDPITRGAMAKIIQKVRVELEMDVPVVSQSEIDQLLVDLESLDSSNLDSF